MNRSPARNNSNLARREGRCAKFRQTSDNLLSNEMEVSAIAAALAALAGRASRSAVFLGVGPPRRSAQAPPADACGSG
jgi:hypothetical protein